jgi:hypothetical protein
LTIELHKGDKSFVKSLITCLAMTVLLLTFAASASEQNGIDRNILAKEFQAPPNDSKPWCYWWWLNGAASKEGITRDFEEMRKQGISGALLFDAGEAGLEAPRGPKFMSDEWRELFKHAVREADRCGIVLGVNLCSGWDAGGPWITHEHAAKKLVAAVSVVKGPGSVKVILSKPSVAQDFYRDIAVLAASISDEACKDYLAGKISLTNSLWGRSGAIEITKFLDQNGTLNWDAPAGNWQVLRIGYTLHGDVIKCVGGGPAGLEIDTMSASAMDAHFAETGAKLIADAGPLAGKALQYFHIDSWELGQPTWTPRMRDEFTQRRGYDPLMFLPALAGRIVDDDSTTRRFLQDYRRTAADLVAANYYGRLRQLTLQGGLRGTHPESGGPFFTHWIDGLQCEGINDVPMGEFWKRNIEPDGPITHHHNPSLKQAASAAHIYGKRDCQAEAFTSFGDDWKDDPWSMKDIGDAAFCEGLTRNVLCFWVHQPKLDAKPGFQWAHVGTHFDCNLTWWPMSGAWLTYLARCQHLLRQGLFAADFAYLQDETIPGFIPPRPDQKPALPPGFDYDAINAEALLTRAYANHGKLTLPHGMSYRYLVLPHQQDTILSPVTLKKVNELAAGGVTVIGPEKYSRSVAKMRSGELHSIALADGLAPDVEFRNLSSGAKFDWIHRIHGPIDIYFISNQSSNHASAEILFRVAGKQPELWDAVSGSIRDLTDWEIKNGRTLVPLDFAPRQSWFVLFIKASDAKNGDKKSNFPTLAPVQELSDSWAVSFDPAWGGPGKVAFDKLIDWTMRPEKGIHYYSGIATYQTIFSMKSPTVQKQRLFLDLGQVKNVARVKINDRDLGVVWTAPWQIEITNALRLGANSLEIEVANLWPNRLIGDSTKPVEKRLTATNVRTYDTMASGTYGCAICEERKRSGKPAQALPSGLLGPVKILTTKESQ